MNYNFGAGARNNPQLALGLVEMGSELISGLLNARGAKKQAKKNRRQVATANLISALSKGRINYQPNQEDYQPGF